MTANEDQIRFWNEKAGRDWVELQGRMDANLAGTHAAVMAFAAPRAGETVLDIGCGTGTTTMALDDAVGDGGQVTGADISAPMLALARQRAESRTIAFVEGDASVMAFAPDHDLVFSRFGVMFFDDPAQAFANLRRAVKPGGRIAFICWRTAQENLWASAPLAAARPFLPEMPPPDPLAPGPFAFADAGRVKSILEGAGFRDVRVEAFDGVMNMGGDVGRAAAQTLQLGPLSRALGEADAATRENISAAVQAALGKFIDGQGNVTPPVACWLVGARA